jgi:hypothetical protein
MSFLNSIISNSNRQQIPFTIYKNAYLTSEQDEIAQQTNAAITMTGFYEFDYTNQINVAFEPLENSDFSSDSVQNNPFELVVVGTVSKEIKNSTYTATKVLEDQAIVEAALNQYLNSTLLLCIIPRSPLFRVYSNLKLLKINYGFTADKSNLVPYLSFRQIRQTTPEYGGLVQSQVANPTAASPVNNGNVNTTTPTIQTNSLMNVA